MWGPYLYSVDYFSKESTKVLTHLETHGANEAPWHVPGTVWCRCRGMTWLMKRRSLVTGILDPLKKKAANSDPVLLIAFNPDLA